ncbi:MAG: hypothetical protein R3267_11400 [Paenisporosarcina sp.]|nr:hypothetical protein [Paenisporosarcina sp.]
MEKRQQMYNTCKKHYEHDSNLPSFALFMKSSSNHQLAQQHEQDVGHEGSDTMSGY